MLEFNRWNKRILITITIGILNGIWKIDFLCQSIIWGEKGVFLVVILEWISDDVHCALFPPTPVANAEVCSTTNCWHKFGNHDLKFFYRKHTHTHTHVHTHTYILYNIINSTEEHSLSRGTTLLERQDMSQPCCLKLIWNFSKYAVLKQLWLLFLYYQQQGSLWPFPSYNGRGLYHPSQEKEAY